MKIFKKTGGEVRQERPGFVETLIKKFYNPPAIAIGFPKGKAASTLYPDGTAVVDVAFWNNYGTFNEDGSVHIPARPFMDVGGLRAAQETKDLKNKLILAVINEKMDMNKAADIIGAKAAAIMKQTIRDFDDPPNAPSTIRQKKSANPLIDTGLMMQTVTWEVLKKNGKVEKKKT